MDCAIAVCRWSANSCIWSAWIALALVLFASTGSAADPGSVDEQVTAQLAAGEFSAVAQRAASEVDPATRDRIFSQLALAQIQSGARTSASESIRAIDDPRLQRQTVDQARGASGGTAADFDALIELIQSTVAADSWEAVGGPGAVTPFAGGVYVEPDGLMLRVATVGDTAPQLRRVFQQGKRTAKGSIHGEARRETTLRFVSLPRLEREIELRHLTGDFINEEMHVLAGLQRVEYVFIYPDAGDVVLAGPAGDWRRDGHATVSARTGLPVVRLEDLVVLMRRQHAQPDTAFGCSITPKQTNLAATQQYLHQTTQRPLKPGQRNRWIQGIRDTLGRQDISVFGLDPRSRAARVFVEADYHMKLVGMGLAEGVLGVKSYLATVPVGPNKAAPPMSVLRWWFTLNYDQLVTTRERLAFAFAGPGVKVLSENELLTQRGERVHTGQSDELTAQFAANFTRHFEALATKYPIYADLRNLFDLAVVVALLDEQGIYNRVDWEASALLDPNRVNVSMLSPPREVESVINHRVVADRYIVVGVSGGVSVDPDKLVTDKAMRIENYTSLSANHRPIPVDLNRAAWWWDVPVQP